MANLTIWKYPLPLQTETETIDMPDGARLLSLQVQHGTPYLWALVDPTQPMVQRTFAFPLTGDTGIEGEYIGTVLVSGGNCVLHLFEVTSLLAIAPGERGGNE